VILIAKWGLLGAAAAEGSKKRSPSVEGLLVLSWADRPPTAKHHYLQLLGTYLVNILAPAAAVRPWLVAVVLLTEPQAQSIAPAAVAAITAPPIFGVSMTIGAAAI
jgi:hypothetical protein